MFMNQHRRPALNISGLVSFVVVPSECLVLRYSEMASVSLRLPLPGSFWQMALFSSSLLLSSLSARFPLSSPLSHNGCAFDETVRDASSLLSSASVLYRRRCGPFALSLPPLPLAGLHPMHCCPGGMALFSPVSLSPLRLYCPAGIQSVRRWPPFSLSSLSFSAVPAQYPPGQGGSSGNVQSAQVGP